jgi:nucleoside-diphosphate-sugar epimerase
MTVLVTGATGFLGSYVVAGLTAAGHAVKGFDVNAPGAEALAIAPSLKEIFIQGHIDDAAMLRELCLNQRITTIVHTAALVGLETSLQQPAATYLTNIMGFVNMCEAARQSGVGRVVLVSSNAVYHGSQNGQLSETDPVFSVERGNPAGHYGTSKMMQEAVALAYATSHSMDVAVLRVTAIYGFGMRAPLYIKPMVENAVLGKPTRIPSGGPMKRDYTYVLDCAAAIVLAVGASSDSARPRVLNVSAGRVLTAAAVADVVRRTVPGADIEIGDSLTPLESENAKMRAPLDITAARAALGWSPIWSIESGVTDYVERFRRFHAGIDGRV